MRPLPSVYRQAAAIFGIAAGVLLSKVTCGEAAVSYVALAAGMSLFLATLASMVE